MSRPKFDATMERARHQMEESFGVLRSECRIERALMGRSKELHEFWSLVGSLRGKVYAINQIRTGHRLLRYWKGETFEEKRSRCLMWATTGLPAKLCRAKLLLRKLGPVMRVGTAPAKFCKWSGMSFAEVVIHMADEIHEALSRVSKNRCPSWSRVMTDPNSGKWKYKIHAAGFADLDNALSSIPSMDFKALTKMPRSTASKEKRRGRYSDRTNAEWVLWVLQQHHGTPAKPKSDLPMTLRQIEDKLDGKVAFSTVGRKIRDMFGTHMDYKAACDRRHVQKMLQITAKTMRYTKC